MPVIIHRYLHKIQFMQINEMKQRTEEEWRILRDNAILAILMGRSANGYYGEMSIQSLIDDALMGSDYLVEELKKREEIELQ